MKKFKTTSIIMILTSLMIFLLTACSNPGSETTIEAENEIVTQDTQETEESDIAAKSDDTALPTRDRSGNEITVPETIDSIISMAPSSTEILIDLGLEEKIVAADTQTQFYGLLSEDISYFDMMTPDSEQIIALEPDIVFVSEMSAVDGADPYKAISNAGICVAYIPSSVSIEGIYEDILFIADCLQVSHKGQELVDGMKNTIEDIKAISENIEDKKSVYFEIAAAPDMYSFGNGTFLNEMTEIIGADNVLADQEGWLSVSEESVIVLNPDIVLTNVNYIEAPVDEIKSRDGWDVVSAVTNEDVYYIDNKLSSLPDQNIITALKQMAEAVYPDLYDFQ